MTDTTTTAAATTTDATTAAAATTSTTTAQTTTAATATGGATQTADAGAVKSFLDPGATTAQTDAEKAAADAKAAEAAKPVVPEKYEFKFADGQKVDEARTTKFSEVARSLNLSQDAAQKVVDLAAEFAADDAKRQQDDIDRGIEEWRKATIADKEIGGADFEKNRAVALTAMRQFGTPALVELMENTGLGLHPEMVRYFWKVGKAIAEDSVVNGASGGAGQRSLADVAYGDSMKNL